jgi:hypothetical protein
MATKQGPDISQIVTPGTEGTRNGIVPVKPEPEMGEGPVIVEGTVGIPTVYRPAKYRLPNSGNVRIDN